MKDLMKLLCFIIVAYAAETTAVLDYNVRSFSSHEIQSGHLDSKLEEILTTTGLLAIRIPIANNVNKANTNRDISGKHMLRNLCHCDSQNMANIPNGDSTILADGLTRRSTIATASRGSTPLGLPEREIDEVCGQGVYESLERMRDYVSVAASEIFIPALDRIIQKHSMKEVAGAEFDTILEKSSVDRRQLLTTNDDSGGYSTIGSIFEDANHLEHFHLYSKYSNDMERDKDAKTIDSALDWHTDGGLFLAFIPGENCHDNHGENDDGSFRVAIPISNNSNLSNEMKAVFPDSSKYENEIVVAIMLGAGAQYWLNTPTSLQLKATKHAVKMKGGDFRAWYGMMHLVPTQAIIQYLPVPRTFGEMKQSSVHSVTRTFGESASNKPQTDIAIGCGNVNAESFNTIHQSRPYRHLQHVSGQEACKGSGNYFCWLSCLSTPDGDDDSHLNNNESLYCLDPSVLSTTKNLTQAVEKCSDPLSGIAGGVMHAACQNYWHSTIDGVQSYLQPDKSSNGDSSHVIESKYCYGATAMYMQGFEWEGTTCVAYLFRSWVISTRLALVLACIGTIFLAILTEIVTSGRKAFLRRSFESLKAKLFLSALTYGIQLTLGYAVMLIVMSYSGPLVISCIIGLMIGHVVTNWNRTSSDEIELGGSTPCCQYEGDRNDENVFQNDESEKHESRSSVTSFTDNVGGCGCEGENFTV